MPRNPNTPFKPHEHCKPVVNPISTTENIKLQLWVDKIESQLRDDFVAKADLEDLATKDFVDEQINTFSATQLVEIFNNITLDGGEIE